MKKIQKIVLAIVALSLSLNLAFAQTYKMQVVKDVKIKPNLIKSIEDALEKDPDKVPVCEEQAAVGEIDCYGRLYVDRAMLDSLIAGGSYEANDELFDTYDDKKINTYYVTDMSELFKYNNNIKYSIANWDVSNVTNMYGMFYGAQNFNQPIGNWDVNNVTNMGFLFTNASSFNQSIGMWDTSNVIFMEYSFYGANGFEGQINDWDVSNVTDMNSMFRKNKAFNQPLNNWDVRKVEDMSYMFAESVFGQDISNWCVSQLSRALRFSEDNDNLIIDYYPDWRDVCD